MKTVVWLALTALAISAQAGDVSDIDRMSIQELRKLARDQMVRIADLDGQNHSLRSQLAKAGIPVETAAAITTAKPLGSVAVEQPAAFGKSPLLRVELLELHPVGGIETLQEQPYQAYTVRMRLVPLMKKKKFEPVVLRFQADSEHTANAPVETENWISAAIHSFGPYTPAGEEWGMTIMFRNPPIDASKMRILVDDVGSLDYELQNPELDEDS